jgi:DnaK suppressor protein
MTKKDAFLKEQEEKLKKEKEGLEKELSSFAKKDKRGKNNWQSIFPDFDGSETGGSSLEVAQDEVEEYINRLPIEYALELKLKEVNLALEKIKKGEYGRCEKCKKEIPQNRLKAKPEARFCFECAKRK